MDKQIVISIKTIIITLLMLSGLYILVRLGAIIGMVIISLLIVVSVEPIVQKIMQTKLLNKPVPRNIAVVVTYFIIVMVFLGILTSGLQPVLEQIQKLLSIISELFMQYNVGESLRSLDVSLNTLLPEIPTTSGGVLSVLSSIFTNFAALISVLVISIYTSIDWTNLKERFFSFFSGRVKSEVEEIFIEIESKIGHWVKGQLTLMLVVGLLCFAGLLVLGVQYPLALGIISGFLEFIPMFGPFISAILAGIVGFSFSFTQGVLVIFWYIIVQELENNILVPKIMHKASGFSPLFVLLAILIGGEFFGLIGVILAVPISMVSFTILKRILISST
ncbi:AI-2E family transporter [Patescibacteria group bacterium]|nr:AI-2E family transporter [Patescibacteria group bacterium]